METSASAWRWVRAHRRPLGRGGYWSALCGEGLFDLAAFQTGEPSPDLVVGLIQGGLDGEEPIREQVLFAGAAEALVAGHHPSYPDQIPTAGLGYQLRRSPRGNQAGFFDYSIEGDPPPRQLFCQGGLVDETSGGLGEFLGGFGGQIQAGCHPLGTKCGPRPSLRLARCPTLGGRPFGGPVTERCELRRQPKAVRADRWSLLPFP